MSKDIVQFIGHSWTLERKRGYIYITDAISATTVSLDDPAYHRPNEPGWLHVPEYVLRCARKLQVPRKVIVGVERTEEGL